MIVYRRMEALIRRYVAPTVVVTALALFGCSGPSEVAPTENVSPTSEVTQQTSGSQASQEAKEPEKKPYRRKSQRLQGKDPFKK